METARECRLPVTVLLGVREEDGKYNDRDKVMQIAFTLYQKSVCSGCGLPASVARGDHNVGRIQISDEHVCHGCQAVESYQESRQDKPYPGQKIAPVVDWDWD